MFNYLRRKLLLDLIVIDLRRTNAEIAMLRVDNANLCNDVAKLSLQLGSVTPAIGRILAKLEPILTKDHLDPKIRAESDKIGQEAMNRLEAEHKARQHTIDGSF